MPGYRGDETLPKEPRAVAPLGIFGAVKNQGQMEAIREDLRRLVGIIPVAQRQRIANYLRAGETIAALMEHTRDVLDGRFEVPGGSALCTDGAFFWRCDASEYVNYYGVGLPAEFLDHGESLNWAPPRLSTDEIEAIDTYLSSRFSRPYDDR